MKAPVKLTATKIRGEAEEALQILRSGGPRAAYRVYGWRLSLSLMRRFCDHPLGRWEGYVKANRKGSHAELLRDAGIARLVCLRCGAVLDLGSIDEAMLEVADAQPPVSLDAGDEVMVAGDRIVSTAGYGKRIRKGNGA